MKTKLMRLAYALFFVFLAPDAFCGPPIEEWVARFDYAGYTDQAFALAVDADGNVYVTGSSHGDYATIKYLPDGRIAPGWPQRYNGPANSYDAARALAVDADGNVYVTGGSYGEGTLFDYATIKYLPDGTIAPGWPQRYNGPANSHDTAWALAVDADGNVYATGFSDGEGTYVDYATIKYLPDGTIAPGWPQRYNGPFNHDDFGRALAVDADGNVYVTGESSGEGTLEIYDYATIKYEHIPDPPYVREAWVARYNGPGNSTDYCNALAVDADGNVYVTGESSGEGTSTDYATIKYLPDGRIAPGWPQRYNGPANSYDAARALAVDADGNVYVTGESSGEGTSTDYATIKYLPDGTIAPGWPQRYNGPGNSDDSGRALVVDAVGNVYATGYSYGEGTFTDYATVKYLPDGMIAPGWPQRYNGPGNHIDYSYALVVDADGNVYVTGESVGEGTLTDYATIKYAPCEQFAEDIWIDQSLPGQDQTDPIPADFIEGTGAFQFLGPGEFFVLLAPGHEACPLDPSDVTKVYFDVSPDQPLDLVAGDDITQKPDGRVEVRFRPREKCAAPTQGEDPLACYDGLLVPGSHSHRMYVELEDLGVTFEFRFTVSSENALVLTPSQATLPPDAPLVFSVAGGSGSYSWELIEGSDCGDIGPPQAGGSEVTFTAGPDAGRTCTLRVEDPTVGQASVEIEVASVLELEECDSDFDNCEKELVLKLPVGYETQVRVLGGTPDYSWDANGGADLGYTASPTNHEVIYTAPTVAGNYYLQATDDSNPENSVSILVQVMDRGRALVVVGGGTSFDPGSGADSGKLGSLAGNTLHNLMEAGFKRDHIRLLFPKEGPFTPYPLIDWAQNNYVDQGGWIGNPTLTNFKQALSDLSQGLSVDVPLYLIMIDHGGYDPGPPPVESFLLSSEAGESPFLPESEYKINSTDLSNSSNSGLLDCLQGGCLNECLGPGTPTCDGAQNSKVAIVYDACHSGAFRDELVAIDTDPQPPRLVLLSTSKDDPEQLAHFSGTYDPITGLSIADLSFNHQFFQYLWHGLSLHYAYEGAKHFVESFYGNQNPTRYPGGHPDCVGAPDSVACWMGQTKLNDIFTRDLTALGEPLDQQADFGDDIELTLYLPTPEGDTPAYGIVSATIIPPDPEARGVLEVALDRDPGLDTAQFDGYSATVFGYLTVAGRYNVALRGIYEDGIASETRFFGVTVCDPAVDADCDGVPDGDDNCPQDANWEQEDDDEDGYGAACDCNDDDGSIHPAAVEIPYNGTDENCDGQDCFIATAAFGTGLEGKIGVLREVRDRYLTDSALGQAFVRAYYRYSPPVADYITEHGWLRSLVSILLLPLIGFASLVV